MFTSSPASRPDAATSGADLRSKPVSSSRYGTYGVRQCAAARLLKKECSDGANEQKCNVRPAEPIAPEGPNKKTVPGPAATTSRQCPLAAEEDKYAVKTEISAATVTDEKSPSAHNASDLTLNHDECYDPWPEHTDACWNDPRWNEMNKKKREKLEERIKTGTYFDTPSTQVEVMSSSQRFKIGVADYGSKNPRWDGYTNIRITRAEDGGLVANINRDRSDLFCILFRWNGNECALSGYTEMAPLVINMDTGKIYEQRGDQYAPYELEWLRVEASPDGKTFLTRGEVGAGFPPEYRFYNAAKPDEGFRYLPCGFTMVVPGTKQISKPKWDTDQNGQTTVTLTVKKDDTDCVDENGDPVVFIKTFRREEGRMVEVASETRPAESDSCSSDEN